MTSLNPPLLRPHYQLADGLWARDGQIYLTGVQALVRLPLMQQMRDRAAGVNTAGFISGYRGSPLGGFDLELWKARKHLKASGIEFTPGLNEDLGATMVWGSQQTNLFQGAKYDGVFSMWYGKGPGVDRCGDVFKHGNAAGTSKLGGVLALAADDHACRSSTLPHGSEGEFESAMMPVLNPAGVQDILDMGLLGWAMSRYTGRWIGFKTIAETVESSASVNVNPHQLDIILPGDFELPPGGLNIRWPDPPLDQEMRLHQYAVKAAQAFARANHIDKVVVDSPKARLGIVTTGKSYLDVLQAIEYLGIDRKVAEDIGIRVYKVGMTWPLEPLGIREFARGLEDIIVVEEKRSFVERQMKEYMYNWEHGQRPSIVGKYDEAENWVLPSTNELTPARIARVIASRVQRFFQSEAMDNRLKWIAAKEKELAAPRANFPRVPHYCSGCPHNSSTVVPEGSRALGGIGCHYMVTWMDRNTETFTQMGGEGAAWLGQAPFTETRHVFQNIGDGTYFHSGILAIRAAVAAGVNITYKILYNDAVAMTGGQHLDGSLTVEQLIQQLAGEGVQRIALVSDDPDKYPRGLAARHPGVALSIHHRDRLEGVQRELREVPGTTVIIYDQVCATELRRRRKRREAPAAERRVFINERVCEGCGDCGVQSNCLSVVAVETPLGRKRAIDQSACNQDFSCLKGFCPSFVSVHGAKLKRIHSGDPGTAWPDLPAPEVPALTAPFNVLLPGVGGMGVLTLGAVLGMAAHLEGRGALVMTQTGLAQKFGAVTSHVRIAPRPEDIHAHVISRGSAQLLLGADLVVASGRDSLARLAPESRALVNSHESLTADFTRNPDAPFPGHAMEDAIRAATAAAHFIDAASLARALLGDAIAANFLLLGHAWQLGLVPLSEAALAEAIRLNGVSVEQNLRAFTWGRRHAVDAEAVRRAAGIAEADYEAPAETLDQLVDDRAGRLTAYQSRRYAERYRKLIDRVRAAEAALEAGGDWPLTRAVARNYFKLLAYKDEYEVARLYTDGEFRAELERQFEGDYRLSFHLAPPLLARRHPDTGRLIKREFGPWILRAFALLARLRCLRGTPLDPFGYTAERRLERQLIADYEQGIEDLLRALNADNRHLAAEIAGLPEFIRGFGHVKELNLAAVRRREAELRQRFATGDRQVVRIQPAPEPVAPVD